MTRVKQDNAASPCRPPENGPPPRSFFLSRYFHDLAPPLGFDGKHGAELARVAGNRDGAELGEPLFEDGIGERGIGIPVQEVDGALTCNGLWRRLARFHARRLPPV